jgi:two-component system nitrogen regulation sensor histidine kinase NtrY
VLARTSASVAMSESVSTGLMDRAKDGEVIVLVDQGDRVRALVKLDGFVDAYLFIGRHIDPRVLAHRERTSLAMLAYEGIESRRVTVQRTFMAINIVATLLLLPTAVWLGLMLAARPRGAPPEAPSKPAETSS